MSSPVGAFQTITEQTVQRFLHTVVVIDDQAFRRRNAQPPGELISPGLSMPGSVPSKQEAKSAKEAATHPPAEVEDPPDFDLDAEEVIRLFAKMGVVCAVLEPQDPTTTGVPLEETMPAAKRADALILDWRIHDTDGDHALSLIRGVLNVDADHSGRLRLILIYTAEPELNKVYQRLKQELATDRIVLKENAENLVLTNSALRIAVLAKPTALLQGNSVGHIVAIENLPTRLISEFAQLTNGLVANVALNSLAVLRNQTHTLLAHLGRDMDAAFLTHRTLLPNPDDSIEHVADLVAGEISALLQSFEVGKISDSAAVEAWVHLRSKYSLHGKELNPTQVVALVRDGYSAKQWAGKEGGTAFSEQFGCGKRKLREYLTAMLVEPEVKHDDIDRQFTVRTSMVRRYEKTQPPPWLRLGTILQDEQNTARYFVCVQPSCHCVRLGGQERAFLFAPATTDGKSDLAQFVRVGDTFHELKISLKSYKLERITFAPSQPEDIVRAYPEGTGYSFSSSDGLKYRWVGQLKDMYAQRVANRLGHSITEVALNEYEWARTSETE
jgi:hypothetical protein